MPHPDWPIIAALAGATLGAVATVIAAVIAVRGSRADHARAEQAATQTSALESVDRRISEAFEAKDSIIAERVQEIGRLTGRLEAAERTGDARQERYDRRLNELSARIEILARSEDELRVWAVQMSAWASRAFAEIHRLKGSIDAPPPLPEGRVPGARLPRPRPPSD